MSEEMPQEIPILISKAIEGRRRPDDLYRIFSWLRFQADDREPLMRDFGHFLAHREKRNQGYVFERVQEIFYNEFVHSPLWVESRDMMVRSYKRIRTYVGDDAIASFLKTPLSRFRVVFPKALRRIQVDSEGKMTFADHATPEELACLNALWRLTSAPPPYMLSELLAQLTRCLLRHGVITEDQKAGIFSLHAFVGALVVLHLHDATFTDIEGYSVRFQISTTPLLDERVIVSVLMFRGNTGYHARIFDTQLPAADLLSLKLRVSEGGVGFEFAPDRDVALEIDDAGLLTAIGEQRSRGAVHVYADG